MMHTYKYIYIYSHTCVMLPPSQSAPNQLVPYDSLAPTQDRKPLLPMQVFTLPPTLPSLQSLRKPINFRGSIKIH